MKKKNISFLASPSPGHERLPVWKTINVSNIGQDIMLQVKKYLV